MASSRQPLAVSPRRPFLAPGRIALVGSVLLHASLLSFVGLVVRLPPKVGEHERLQVVWLHDWQLAALGEAERRERQSETDFDQSAVEEARSAPPEDSGGPPATERLTLEVAETQSPADDADAPELAEHAAEPAADRDDEERDAVALEADPDGPRPPSAADLQAAHQRVLERMREERMRERGYSTFSLDDLAEEAESPEEARSAWAEVFEGRGSIGPGRAALVPGQARTRVGRAAREFCNALTGGATVLGVMSICAAGGGGRTPLYALRPDYLKKLPFCYQVPLAEERLDSSGEAVTTATRCVLLTEEERALAEAGGIEALR